MQRQVSVARWMVLVCALAILVATSWVGMAQQRRRIDDGALRRPPAEEWVTYGLNYAEQRYSTLKAIDTTNVSRLGLSWTTEIGAGGGGQEATPLVANGVMYVVTNWSNVYALDARTGKEIWHFDPLVDRRIGSPGALNRVCCGVVNRGLALYQDRVFVAAIDGRLIAIDAANGKQVWEMMTVPKDLPYSITMAPRVVKGKVIVGNSGAEYAVRGYVSAYNANDGKMAWRFYTVPGDPSKPFEHPDLADAAKTWTGEWWKAGGGGTVWDSIAFDPDSDLLYIGVGNGGPWNRDVRSPGGGDNLYLSSIVALKPDTGKYVWHYQTTPGDNWDYTAVQHIMLADVRINGRDRKVLFQAPKNGFFYMLDRVSGEFLSAQPYAEVNWAKGIDEKGRPIVNPEAWYGLQSVTLSPGPGGAHNWSPMSFNPATGLVYLPAGNSSSGYARAENFVFRIGSEEFKGTGQFQNGVALGGRGGRGAANAPAPVTPPPMIGPEAGRGVRGGFLLAWDPLAQKERWRQPGGGGIGGGTVSTAGNLVIQVVPDGRLIAYSADKGDKLLEITTGINSVGPPVTYQLDGKQYVSFMGGRGGGGAGRGAPAPGAAAPPAGPRGAVPNNAGGGPILPATPEAAPVQGAAAPNAAGQRGTPRVLTFVLDGKTPLPGAVQ